MKIFLFQKFNFNYIFFLLYLFACIITTYIEFDDEEETESDNTDNTKKTNNDKGHLIQCINLFVTSLSDFLAIIPYFIKKRLSGEENISRTVTKNEDEQSERSISNYIYNNAFDYEIIRRTKHMNINSMLVGILEFLSDIIYFLIGIFNINPTEKNTTFYLLNCTVIFQILLQYFLSRFILKVYFYRHHYLSIIINTVSFITLFILDFFNNNMKFDFILMYFLTIITLTMANAYGKKAMIFGYISPFGLLIYKGLYKLLFLIIFSVIFIPIMGSVKDNFFEDSEKIDGEKILMFILNFLFSFLKNLFNWILIDRFSLNHLALSLILEDLSYGIIFLINYEEENNSNSKIKIQIWEISLRMCIFVILFIAAMIHNEIFIITRCGLGDNTKLFLDEKVKEEMSLINNEGDQELLKRFDSMIELEENFKNGETEDNKDNNHNNNKE